MSFLFTDEEKKLVERKNSILSKSAFELMDKIIDHDPDLNGKIMIGGVLGKRTVTQYDETIEFFIVSQDKKLALKMIQKSQDIIKISENVEREVKVYFSYFNIEKTDSVTIDSKLLKIGSIHYLRHKFVLKFIKKFDSLIEIIKIIKIWSKIRKIGLEDIILELISIEAFYRLETENNSETEVLKSVFRTLHNTMEGISIVPRDWFEISDITTSVSELGIKIVDPGDLSNNLGKDLMVEQDVSIRNECLRAISLIEMGNPHRLIELK